MLRSLILTLSMAALLPAAVLPEQAGEFRRAGVTGVTPSDLPVWQEFGYEAGERATYATAAGQSFSLSAYRFADATGAQAALQWLRPKSPVRQHANYLLQLDGERAAEDVLKALLPQLPNVVNSSLPPLTGYLPAKGRVPNSERYILGPASLALFEPRIEPALAAFERGAEGQSAQYRTASGSVQLTIFSYPTPQMAIERFRHYQQLPDVAAKRSGTLIAVVPGGKENVAAERLLAQVNYSPKLTWSEEVPKATVQDAAKMILAIVLLALGLIVASVVAGILLGGWKVLARRMGFKAEQDEFTALHIGEP